MNLRDEITFLEDELGKLRTEKLHWEVERVRAKRESEILEDKLNDATRVLSLSKEAELNAKKRYDRAMEYKQEVEDKMDALLRGFDVERGEMMGKLSELKKELKDFRSRNEVLMAESREMERLKEKLEDLMSRNEVLLNERVKFEDFKERLIEKDDELEVLRDRNKVLELEMAKFGVNLREKDGKIDDLMKKCVQLKEIKDVNVNVKTEGFTREMARLKAAVRKKDEQIVELNQRNYDLKAREDEDWDESLNSISVLRSRILKITSNRNRKIEELEKEKVGLEKENREVMAKYNTTKKMLSKLEGDVAAYIFFKAKQDEKLGSSQTEYILSVIANLLDREQSVTIQGNLNTANSKEDAALVSHAKDVKCSLKSVINSEVVAETSVLSEDDHSGKNGAQKSQSLAYIQISDSDDEEVSCHVSGVKRTRASPVCFNQKHSDDSVNPKHKTKKLEHVVSETAKHVQSIAESDFISDHKCTTLHKQKESIKKGCKGKINSEVRSAGLEGYCKVSSRRNKTEILKYMGKCQQNEKNCVFEGVADMVVACKNDPVLCAKAVHALDRKGLLCSGQRGFEKCDIDRGGALAAYLVEGDSNRDSKSLDELEQHDPEGLNICRKLVCRYSHELFKMFKSSEDPLFSQLSTYKQYR